MNRRFDPVLFALLLVSLAGNVYLARRGHHPAQDVTPLRVGDRVNSLKGLSLNAEPAVISFNERQAILYVFSPKCGWCDRNIANAKHLQATSVKSHQFVAVALDESDLVSYLRKNEIEWQIVRSVSPETRRAFRFVMTPQTIVVDVGGTVRHVWNGAYTDDIGGQVQRAFGIVLPGLTSPKAGT